MDPNRDRMAHLKDGMLRSFLVEHDSAEVLAMADDWGVGRDELTDLALSFSLCPIHFIDYAICFDDRTPECYAVRVIHPGHDT